MDSLKLQSPQCHLCAGFNCRRIAAVSKKPDREIELDIKPEDYLREVYLCNQCGVMFNYHNYRLDNLYRGNYNKALYNNQILDNYWKIRNIPEEKSINKQRVKRVVQFIQTQGRDSSNIKILDVGSGLCVFLGELKDLGFKCYCIDPDVNCIEHARKNVKVEGAYCGSLNECSLELNPDLISFNRVLEHIKNPLAVLSKTREIISNDGFVYLELPDGSAALRSATAQEREEFFIDHYTIFTQKALRWLAQEAGFQCIVLRSIYEPADKFTLYAFLKKKIRDNGE